ncbi:hypothetical protein F4778DRAFT_438694 [Xylariomycetidae sp. FL2044]|nr:hypothetical protein F4778DRAFT_438694 [Xylariomycetidae sp. FL2044]
MASRKFFDPAVLLALTPVVSSTCSLLFAHDQHFFLTLLTKPDIRAPSNALLPSYFRAFFAPGLVRVLGFLGVTVGSSAALLLLLRTSSAGPLLRGRGAFAWYAAGASFAAGHLLFVPLVAPRIRAICEDQGGENVNVLKSWLFYNAARGCTVDLAAWVCCLVAAAKTFSLPV